MNDDGIGGWVITGAYFAAAIVALVSAVRTHAALRHFSFGCAALLAALGANKQLDVQTRLIALGRRAVLALGVYEHRDALHVLFPIVVGVGLVVILAIAVRALWSLRRKVALTLAGFALLALFVVLRVALFSHLTRVLGWTWLETELAGVLEIAAIAAIVFGLLVQARAAHASERSLSAKPGSPRGRS